MRPLSLDALDAERDAFDAASAATAGVDTFCSSTDWGLPAHRAFMPNRAARIFGGAHGYAALMEHVTEEGGRLWLPLEVVWGLGSPFVGPDPRAIAAETAAFLGHAPGWDAILVTGVPREAPLLRAIAGAWRRPFRLTVETPPLRRCVIDLEGGVDGFLARRSRNFRRAALRARARAEAEGIRFESILTAGQPRDDGPALFARMMAVERASWKGGEGVGLAIPDMEAFYEAMVPRLAARGRLALTFARATDNDRDVGYILGAVFAGAYRGLQFSYDDAYAALGLGNVLQLHTMDWAAQQGLGLYDLGAEVEYKLRWSDRVIESLTIVVRR